MEPTDVRGKYRRRAARYDTELKLFRYSRIFDYQRYQHIAVSKLRAGQGGVVLDLGCGTGLNFPLLQGKVGPTGKIIGLDVTPEMLEQARRRIEKAGWMNVELVEADAAQAALPAVDAVFSTAVFSVMADPGAALVRAVDALKPGGELVVADWQLTRRWYRFVVNPIAGLIDAPYGKMKDLEQWDMRREMGALLQNVEWVEYYLGLLYVTRGVKL